MTTARLAGTKQFLAFTEVCPDAIIIVDGTNAILLVNVRAASLFGYEPTDLIGKPVDLLIAGFPRDAETRKGASQLEAATCLLYTSRCV